MKKQQKNSLSFLGHLEELRWRLVKAVISIIVASVVLFIYRKPIIDSFFISMVKDEFITYQWFCQLSEFLNLGESLCLQNIEVDLMSVKVTGQFSSTMFFALLGGFVLAFPFIAHQIWAFIKPGLKTTKLKQVKE